MLLKILIKILKCYHIMQMVKKRNQIGLNSNILLELHHVANFILTLNLTAELFLERKGLSLHVFEIDIVFLYL